MSETVKKNWLTDKDGIKIAPKTVIDQVIDLDGTTLKTILDQKSDTLITDISGKLDKTGGIIYDDTVGNFGISLTPKQLQVWEGGSHKTTDITTSSIKMNYGGKECFNLQSFFTQTNNYGTNINCYNGTYTGGISSIAPQYNATVTYKVNDYCYLNGKLYKCIIACTGTVPPNTTYWQETTVGNEIPQITVQSYSTTSSSISGGSSKEVKIDVKKTGYTTLGCVGWYISGTSSTNCYTKQAYINSSGEFSIYIKNTGSSACTPTITAQILYIKN